MENCNSLNFKKMHQDISVGFDVNHYSPTLPKTIRKIDIVNIKNNYVFIIKPSVIIFQKLYVVEWNNVLRSFENVIGPYL